MITEKSKTFLGEKVRFDDELGIIVGLTETPNYSPFFYDVNNREIINSDIDKSTMFIVSLESGETAIVAPCRLITAATHDKNWEEKLDKDKILEDLRIYQKREINKVKNVGTMIRGKFVKYPEYNRFIRNLENLKLEVVLWEKL
jgi:hypothetical protein